MKLHLLSCLPKISVNLSSITLRSPSRKWFAKPSNVGFADRITISKVTCEAKLWWLHWSLDSQNVNKETINFSWFDSTLEKESKRPLVWFYHAPGWKYLDLEKTRDSYMKQDLSDNATIVVAKNRKYEVLSLSNIMSLVVLGLVSIFLSQ